MAKADRVQGEGMESLIFPGDATSPTPFGLNSAGLWDEVEVSLETEGECYSARVSTAVLASVVVVPRSQGQLR